MGIDSWGGWGIPSILQISRTGLGTTSAEGLVLLNDTFAAVGAQQISPRMRWTGQGWKTNATAASQAVDWTAELVPVQGAANPQARLDFNYQINAGGYQATPPLSLLNDKVGILNITPAYTLDIAGDIRVTGNIYGSVGGASFTSGSVLFAGASGLLSQNNANFFWDNTNTRLGLGTASPDVLFHVWANAGARFGASSSVYSKVLYDGMANVGGTFTIDAATNFQLRTNVDATSIIALYATTVANVGIGTASFGTSAAKVLSIGAGIAPTTSPTDVTQFWTADWNGAGTNALFLRTEEGTQHVFGSSVGIGTLTFPTATTKVAIFDSTQLAARIGLTGQEFWEAANTSTDGLAFVLGVNRASNRQLWIGDTAALAKNASNTVLRFVVGGTGMPTIDAISTDSTTTKLFALGNASGIQYGKALVALGGGAAPTLGTIGGSGPTVAGQNAWVQLKDSAGADVWVPVWK